MSSNNEFDFELNTSIDTYFKTMIPNLPKASKRIINALAENDYNKEVLSLKSRVRRGELNYAINWIEALGFVGYKTAGRAKLYTLTPLGKTVITEYENLFADSDSDDDDYQ